MKYTDQEIINSLKNQGNNSQYKVFSYLYETYKNIIYSITNKMGDKIEADDLYQETMIIFCEKIKASSFVLTSKLSSFFYGICYYKHLEMLRQNGITTELNSDAIDEPPDEPPALSEIDDWRGKYGDEKMQHCWERLTSKRKNILTKFYYDGLSMTNIAKSENLSNEDHAKSEKYKAILDLRKCMGILKNRK